MSYMFPQPFHTFHTYRDILSVSFLTKEDNARTDADIATRCGMPRVASLWQVHGNRTIVIRSSTERTEKADGFLTDQSNLLLTIRAADCQQILVYAPEHRVIGLLHVGWRGLLPSPLGGGLAVRGPEGPSGPERGRGGKKRTAIQSFFRTLQTEWHISSSNTLVAIGPSLRQCCAEYRECDHPLRQFSQKFWHGNHIDLAGIADAQLIACGVRPDHIERHPDCTCCHPEKYWTYRGGDRGAVLQGYTNVLAAVRH